MLVVTSQKCIEATYVMCPHHVINDAANMEIFEEEIQKAVRSKLRATDIDRKMESIQAIPQRLKLQAIS